MLHTSDLERVSNRLHVVGYASSKSSYSANNNNCNEGCDQAVLDSRCTRFIFNKARNVFHFFTPVRTPHRQERICPDPS